MNEPTTTISTVDYTIGYSPDPPDNRLNILTPVIAPQGPVDLTRVNGPSEYQRLFFGGRSVKSSDDFSAIYARGLVANAPIWIKRGVRNNLKGGLSSALAKEVYTDSELNLIDGIKSYITFDTDSEGFVSYDTTIESTINPVPMSLDGSPIAVTSEGDPEEGQYRVSYSNGLIQITGYGDNTLFLDGAGVEIDKLRCEKYGVRFVVDGTTAPVTDHVVNYDVILQEGQLRQNVLSINSSITGESISDITGFYIMNATGQSTEQIVLNEKMVYATTISNIPVSLRATTPIDTPLKCGLAMDLTSISPATINIGNKAFNFTANPDGFQLSDLESLKLAGVFPQLFLDEDFRTIAVRATKSGSVTKIGNRPIVYLLWNSGVGITSTDSDPQGFTIIMQEDMSSSQYNFPQCLQGIIRDDDEYLENYVIQNISFNVETSDSITYCFYTGNVVPSADINVNLGDELTYEGFFEALVKQGSDLMHADSGEAHSIILPEAIQVTISDSSSVLVLANNALNDIVNNDKFAVLSAFPCDTTINPISVKIAEGSVAESYQLTVSYGTDSEVWEISFDSGVTDGYGNSLYYTNVNENSAYIRIVELSGPNVIYQTLNLGNEVTSKFCGVSEVQTSFELMKESDEASVDFDYITDGGYANPTFGSYIISQLCPYYNSFYVPSVQVGKTLSESELIAYRDAICNSLAQGRLIAATQRTNVLDNGQTEMPASYFYLISRINLGNTVREFVKFMEETNGNIGMQNPIQKFTRTKRENLLDHQIVTLKKGRNGAWFLNECLTLYTSQSYLQEDGTVLMVNKINQLARAYADPLKGQDNTADLRSTVESELLRIINDRVRTGTPYGPINIRVVCNDTNNPVSLQNQRKLRIDIYGTFSRSIKDVLIYTNIIPLS